MVDPANGMTVGIFYDHSWWNLVSAYYRYHSPIQARLELAGIHDMIRWHLHQRCNIPLERCRMSQAHYVRDLAVPPTRFDGVLNDTGITLHRVPGTRPSTGQATTALALEVYDASVRGGSVRLKRHHLLARFGTSR